MKGNKQKNTDGEVKVKSSPMLALFGKIKDFYRNNVCNHKWRCAVCGKDVFGNDYVCDDCDNALPYLSKGDFCEHCGRKTKTAQKYCLTCKGVLTEVDKMRSVFNYEGVIVKLITDFKFKRAEYLSDFFSDALYKLYQKENFNPDIITYVPMLKKAIKKRGYNQTELLANALSSKTGVDCALLTEKVKDTSHQVGLKRKERFENLQGSIRVINRDLLKGKTVLIVDDVTTTGATAEVIAKKLKSGGAKRVYLLTVASVALIKE